MSFKIAIVSQTGDCGKSALAFTLALESMKNGMAAKIFDLDKEHQTCVLWQKDRENFEIKPKLDVELVETAKQAIEGEQGDFLTVYDCPSRASEAIALIAQNVDLVVIPTPPSKKSILLHLALLAKLLKIVPAYKLAVLLTRVKTPSEAANARLLLESGEIDGKTIKDLKIKIFENYIMEKTGYGIALNNGYGLTDTSYLPLNLSARVCTLDIMNQLIYNNNKY